MIPVSLAEKVSCHRAVVTGFLKGRNGNLAIWNGTYRTLLATCRSAETKMISRYRRCMNSCVSAEPHVASNVRYITFSMSLFRCDGGCRACGGHYGGYVEDGGAHPFITPIIYYCCPLKCVPLFIVIVVTRENAKVTTRAEYQAR